MHKIKFRRRILLFALTVIGFVFAGIAQAQNSVGVEVSHIYYSNISENTLNAGTMLKWDQTWLLNLMNEPDGGRALTNPIITLQTDLSFIGIWPSDPLIFTYDPNSNVYTWNFGRVGTTVPEPSHLNVNCVEQMIDMPVNFSATRRIVPKLIDQDVVMQRITVTFALENSLPEGLSNFRMGLGGHMQAYGWDPLLERKVVFQNNIPGWSVNTDGVSAHWYPDDPQNIERGQTFTFIADIEVKKSSGLKGDPIYIPAVMIGYSEMTNLEPRYGNSISISHPQGVTASYTVDNADVEWNPFTTENRFEVNLNSLIETGGFLITGQVTDSAGNPLKGVLMEGFADPPITDANGYYGVVAPVDWSGIVTPRLTDHRFNPPSISYGVVQSDHADQNYEGEVAKTDDEDKDGVDDAKDQCPGSITDPTILIQDCDTRVVNVAMENGCTLADAIDVCIQNADNHGAFVSCISHLARTWQEQNAISEKEKSRIIKCAATSDLP